MVRRKFTKEFKFEAVKLVTERGVAVAQASRDLDLAESVLHREAPAYLAGQLAVRGSGGLALGLPCVADAPSE